MSELPQLGLTKKETRSYITILGSTGDFRKTVPEDTEGAVFREYETSDGKTGSKHELVFASIAGFITKVDVSDSKFGTNINITMSFGKDTDPEMISLSANSPFGEDFMKKAPNINFAEAVVLSPFAFDDDAGKTRKGISITQGDQKIKNAYWDEAKNKPVEGYPEPDGDTKKFKADDWKIYFAVVRKYLLAELDKTIKVVAEQEVPF